MIEGFEIILGGKPYTVPPLNLKGLKKVLPMLPNWTSKSVGSQIDDSVAAMSAALVRNYPDLTPEVIEEMTEASEFPDLMGSVSKLLEISGLVPKEAPAPGELEAPASQSTGAISTATSQQGPDGDGPILTT